MNRSQATTPSRIMPFLLYAIERSLHRPHPILPVPLEGMQPLPDLRQRARLEVVEAMLSPGLLQNQVRLAQHLQVLGHGRPAQLEEAGQVIVDLREDRRTQPEGAGGKAAPGFLTTASKDPSFEGWDAINPDAIMHLASHRADRYI